MKLVILGATRGTGVELVKQALEAGHDVTVVARRPEAVTTTHERLQVVRGDVFDPDSLTAQFRGRDAVLSTIGVTTAGEMFRRVSLYSVGGKNIVAAMKREDVKRGLFVTSGGVVDDDPSFTFFYRYLLKPIFLQRGYDDMIRFEADLTNETSLEWTVVRPTYLNDGPQTGKYRVSPRLCPPGGQDISRADVAEFMLKELGERRFVHGTPTLAY